MQLEMVDILAMIVCIFCFFVFCSHYKYVNKQDKNVQLSSRQNTSKAKINKHPPKHANNPENRIEEHPHIPIEIEFVQYSQFLLQHFTHRSNKRIWSYMPNPLSQTLLRSDEVQPHIRIIKMVKVWQCSKRQRQKKKSNAQFAQQ